MAMRINRDLELRRSRGIVIGSVNHIRLDGECRRNSFSYIRTPTGPNYKTVL